VTASRERVLVNVGCGPKHGSVLPAYFHDWQQLRVDVDAAAEPDILADLTDLSPIATGSADAVWAAHCIEHLYEHQVPIALAEFRRVLRDDGFVCVIVPDLQTVANYLVADRLHEPLYDSVAGPVTPHDIVFGFGAAIAGGRTSMAHRCGFTPGMLQRCFGALPFGEPFGEVLLRRRSVALELVALARVRAAPDEDTEALMSALDL
jgi:SAM-dependent methyltransferase